MQSQSEKAHVFQQLHMRDGAFIILNKLGK